VWLSSGWREVVGSGVEPLGRPERLTEEVGVSRLQSGCKRELRGSVGRWELVVGEERLAVLRGGTLEESWVRGEYAWMACGGRAGAWD